MRASPLSFFLLFLGHFNNEESRQRKKDERNRRTNKVLNRVNAIIKWLFGYLCSNCLHHTQSERGGGDLKREVHVCICRLYVSVNCAKDLFSLFLKHFMFTANRNFNSIIQTTNTFTQGECSKKSTNTDDKSNNNNDCKKWSSSSCFNRDDKSTRLWNFLCTLNEIKKLAAASAAVAP